MRRIHALALIGTLGVFASPSSLAGIETVIVTESTTLPPVVVAPGTAGTSGPGTIALQQLQTAIQTLDSQSLGSFTPGQLQQILTGIDALPEGFTLPGLATLRANVEAALDDA